jgi:uncharacterized protein (TIGR02118 family)
MILLSVMYPYSSDMRFDETYYCETHMSLLHRRWGAMGLKEARVTRGIVASDGMPPRYRMMALLGFSDPESLRHAVATHGKELFDDTPNFTDASPVVQVSEIISTRRVPEPEFADQMGGWANVEP